MFAIFIIIIINDIKIKLKFQWEQTKTSSRHTFYVKMIYLYEELNIR
jgi:hypothetical protein